MIAAKASRSRATARHRLMASGAMGMAIGALLLAPQGAVAQTTVPSGQAFQGTPTVVVPGSATVVQTATQDTITVRAPQAVINWTPNDRTGTGTIDFLPEGLRALFVGDADFTVLNRIIPLDGNDVPIARMIALNGIVDSQINSATGIPSQGGSVWFYSPGGILVGGTGVINVGSLVLSSRDIDTTGGLFGSNGEIRFRDPAIAGALGPVEIAPGARINAVNGTAGSAYIAVVAPRVVQSGTVRADGSVALVAAEQADIRINNGLFDINVTVGTNDPHGIIHTGTTAGPADASGTFESRAYLVAVPKNQAITMLLSGVVGFETPTSATVNANGGIVLSAGNNIQGGVAAGRAAGATGPGNITITDSRFANDVTATATGTITGRPDASCQPNCGATDPTGQLLFDGNAFLSAQDGVNLSVGQGQRIIVGGDLQLLSARPGQGGSVALTIDNALPPTSSTAGGGTISVGGSLLLDSSARGNAASVSAQAIGGTSRLSINSGTLTAGSVSILANAAAAIGGSLNGEDGQGGTAALSISNGGSLTANGGVTVAADGRGSGPMLGPQQNAALVPNGGDGIGGTAQVVLQSGGALTTQQGLTVTADGFGAGGATTSGDGRGGTASVSVDRADLSAGFARVSASGNGGGSGFDPVTFTFLPTNDGGDAFGGTASFSVSNTSTSDVVVGSLTVAAMARGGTASNSANPPLPAQAGNATGGTARFSMSGTASAAEIDSLGISASAVGGNGVGTLANGGSGTGGTSQLSLSGATTLSSAVSVNVRGDGNGGVGDNVSGAGQGGSADLQLGSSAVLNTGTLRLSASGLGGGTPTTFQSFAPSTNIGGNGRGGLVTLTTAGAITASSVEADANGFGGDSNPFNSQTTGLRGGNATGGEVRLTQTGGTITAGGLTARANATGGGSGTAAGTSGSGTAGSTIVTQTGGTASFGNLTLEALGFSSLFRGGPSGDVTGGNASLLVSDTAQLSVDNFLSVLADAGFRGSTSGQSGNATGGLAAVTASGGGTVTTAFLEISASGRAAGSTTQGGVGQGGLAQLTAQSGGTLFARSSSSISANGSGGDGFAAGQGIGGTIDILADGGSLSLLGFSSIDAGGQSGFDFDSAAPEAIGGTINLTITGDEASALSFGQLRLAADASFADNRSSAQDPLDGSGVPGKGGQSAGGNPGDATGGTLNILIEGGTVTGSNMFGSASGFATNGGTGRGGTLDFRMTGGTVTVDSINTDVTGVGGTSPLDLDNSDARPRSGNGFGGTATVSLTGGSLDSSAFTVSASGVGGHGVTGSTPPPNGGEGGTFDGLSFSGDGGIGTGGSIDVLIDGEATINSDFLSFAADGDGGNGGDFVAFTGSDGYSPGSGGSGVGGTVTVDLAGGSLNALSLFADADGRGGDAGRILAFNSSVINPITSPSDADPVGGSAQGGTARVTIGDTTGNASLFVYAFASGGEGGTILRGYRGGDATGGLAELVVDNALSITLTAEIDASGFGGDGGRAEHGIGGDGGDGFGGVARLTAAGGTTLQLTDASTLISAGEGGAGRDGRDGSQFDGYDRVERGFRGGDGGDGIGGTIEVLASGGDVELAINGGEGFVFNNGGYGGFGGDGSNNDFGAATTPTFGGDGGNGGNGQGGTILLRAEGATLTTADGSPLFLQSTGVRGDGGFGGNGVVTSTTNPTTGVTTFFGGNGSFGFSGLTIGGTVRLEANQGDTLAGLVDLADLSIDVGGDIAGRVEFIDDSSGPGIAIGTLNIFNGNNGYSSCGNVALCGSGFYIRSRDGAVTIGQSADLNLLGGFQLDAFDTGGLNVSGAFDLAVADDIVVTHQNREGTAATLSADSIFLNGNRISLAQGTLLRSTAGSIDLLASSSIDFGLLDASENIFLEAGGSIFGDGADATLTVDVAADGSIDIASLTAGENAVVSAGGGVRIDNLSTTNGYADLTGNGVTLGTANIGTALKVLAQNGNAVIGSVTSGASTEINSLANISVGSIVTTNALVDTRDPARGPAILLNARGSVTLGSLDSAGIVFITGASLAQAKPGSESAETQSSIVAADSISIGTSGDIDFGTADGRSISIVSTDGSISFVSTRSATDTQMTATAGSITGGSVTTIDGDARLSAGDSIAIDNADVGDVFALTAGAGGITLGTSISGYDTLLTSDGAVSIVSATTTDIGTQSSTSSANIVIDAVGDVSLGSLTSAEDITINAAGLGGATSSIVAAGDVLIQVDNTALFGSLDAGSLSITAGSAITFTEASADLGASLQAGADVTGSALVSDNGGVTVSTSGGTIALGSVASRFDSTINATGGGVTLGSVTTGFGGVFVDATGTVDIQLANSGGQFVIGSDADIVIGTATAFGDATLDAGSNVRVTSLTTTGQTSSQSSAPTNAAIRITAGGDVRLGTLDSIGSVQIDANSLTAAAATSGIPTSGIIEAGEDVLLDIGGNASFTRISAGGLVDVVAGSVSAASSAIVAGGDASLLVFGNADLGTIEAGFVTASVDETFTFDSIDASDGVNIGVGQDIRGGSIATGGFLTANSAEGNIAIDEVSADSGASLFALGDIDLGSLTSSSGSASFDAGQSASIDSGSIAGALTVESGLDSSIGTVTTGGPASVTAGRDIRVVSLTTTGIGASQSSAPINAAITLSAGGDVLLGTLDAAGSVQIDASSLTAAAPSSGIPTSGIIAADEDVLLDIDGDASFTSIAAGGLVDIVAGSVSAANSSIVAVDDVSLLVFGNADLGTIEAGFVSGSIDGTFTFDSIDAADGVNIGTGGDILGGSISTGGFLSASSAEGNIAINEVSADNGATFLALGDIDLGSLTSSRGGATLDAGQSASIGSGAIADDLVVESGLDSSIGTVTTGGPASVTAGGDISVVSLTTTGIGSSQNSTAPAANILLVSGGAVRLGALDSAGDIAIDAASLTQSGGGSEAPASAMLALGNVSIRTSGDADFGSLEAGTATITTGGSLRFDSSTTFGSTFIDSSGSVTGGTLKSQLGTLTVFGGSDIAVDVTNAGNNAFFSSGNGDIAIGALGAQDDIRLTALSGEISGDSAESQFGTILIDAASVDYGDLESAGTIFVRATGDVAIDFARTNGAEGSGCNQSPRCDLAPPLPQVKNGLAGVNISDSIVLTGSDIIIDAGGDLTLGELSSAEDIVIDAAKLIGNTSSAFAVGSIDIDVTGNARFGSLTAEGSEILVDAGGTIDGSSVTATASDSAIRLTGRDGVSIGTIRAPANLEVRAVNGAITISDVRAGSAIVSGRSADVVATGTTLFTLAEATAGNLTVQGTAGTLTLSDARASGAMSARSSNGALVIGTAQAGSIALQSDTTATLNGAVTATGALTASIRNAATINGVATGSTVQIVSGDIVIGSNGRIGTAGTTSSLTLTNGNNGRQTFIGGADNSSGYSLSAAEMQRLFAGNITLRGSNSSNREGFVAAAPGATAVIAPSGQPNVVIDTFTLTGGGESTGNLGASGTLLIESPGFVRVVGTATLNNMSQDNRFAIVADDAIQVILGQGAIRLNGPSGLGGTLSLNADDIVVATADAITAIAALTDSAAIDERLSQNDGVLNDDGALSANAIAFTASNGIYVQNSGDGSDFDDRRGFTAGAGGVSITTPGSQSPTSGGSTRLVLNGVIDDGVTVLTGLDAFGRVTINGVALTGESQQVPGIDAGSTLNGCLIASASNCFTFEIDLIPPTQDNPLVDDEDEESEQTEGEDSLSVTTVIEIKDVEPLPNEPLIDDPVTGSPNDDLWTPDSGY